MCRSTWVLGLRRLRTNFKGKVLSDGYKLQGKGRLTDKTINQLQNYFGMAIRQNSADAWDGNRDVALYQMKKGILAVLWHCTGFENLETRHQFCPRSIDSWCNYLKKDGKELSSHSINLPQAIHEVLLPIFQDLRADDLLVRCLDGTSQNPNEAFNQIMWKKCPKETFVARKF